ncbi:unnamed protein product [Auanema sp. JU1783]|nr:unnamed protein product [Auanema sp. JU1783]
MVKTFSFKKNQLFSYSKGPERKNDSNVRIPTTIIPQLDIKTMAMAICAAYFFGYLYYAHHNALHAHKYIELVLGILIFSIFFVALGTLGVIRENIALIVPFCVCQILTFIATILAWGYIAYFFIDHKGFDHSFIARAALVNFNAAFLCSLQFYCCSIMNRLISYYRRKRENATRFYEELARCARSFEMI